MDIKVDTYDYQKFGMLSGKVFYVSPDAIQNERQEKVYKVQIELSDEGLNNMQLSQGMECSAEIKTGRRRIIDFFMEPLTDALRSNIKSKGKEVETLEAVSAQTMKLMDAGEASELEVIDSQLAVLKAKAELEGYYFDMNVMYYEIREY